MVVRAGRREWHETAVKDAENVLAEALAKAKTEDKNVFVGVTGSPSDDLKLEKLVSVVLGNGKDGSIR